MLTLTQFSGTGSGSFSHSVARTVGPAGHLWSYEFHETRASKAREEFARHGMDDVVTLAHRNVCKDGFTVVDTVDAVFLDLPAPWEAVEHAKQALRKDRTTRICCFSPCMEQVLRTVSALNEAGFTDITMYETLIRPHQVDSAPALTPISAISEKLKKAEQRREEKRLRQIEQSRTSRGSKRKAEDSGEEGLVGKRPKTDDEDEGEGARVAKVMKEDEDSAMKSEDTPTISASGTPAPTIQNTGVAAETTALPKICLSKAFPEVRGHTSYLTFACLLPAILTAGTPVTVEDIQSTSDSSAATPPKEDVKSMDTVNA